MYSGWFVKWRVNRPLTQQEKDDGFQCDKKLNIDKDDRATLIAYNSTYSDFIDRRFRVRGGLVTLLTCLVASGFVAFLVYAWLITTPHDKANVVGAMITSLFFVVFLLILCKMIIFKDFFSYTYYPIRFNRKARQVYVFRDKRDGGILTLPWEEGYFHIGQGIRDKRLLDLRCHVLEGETVKDTFPTGFYFFGPGARDDVRQVWEFIRTYMDEGPEALHDMTITTSTSPSLRNCFIMTRVNWGGPSMAALVLLFPLIGLLTITRWLVMKSSKSPVWPVQIDEACRVEPNDPYSLSEPAYTGQFPLTARQSAKVLGKRRSGEHKL